MADPRRLLDPDALTAGLASLPGWRVDAGALRRDYTFDRYEAGVGFAVQVALLAQRLDHHPDIEIGWCRVTLKWVTHDAGGLTARDLDAARAVDALS